MANKESSRTSCLFLHHMEYKPRKFAFEGGKRKLNGFAGRCINEGCTFIRTVLEPPGRDVFSRRISISPDCLWSVLTKLLSRRTASRTPSSEASPQPTEKAGVSPSTGTPVPSRGA